MKIGFQGIQGAFSEAAIFKYYGHGVETVGFDNIDEVFDAVVDESVDYGMIPVENSIAGSVSRSYDYFLEKPVHAVAEVYLPVRHFLLGLPGSTLPKIREALSHPMALNQCEKFLRIHQIKPVPEYDTAGSAKIVAEQADPAKAAIAAELAAQYYHLKILAEDIQTTNINMTRFLVVSGESAPDIRMEKTSVAFKTKHFPGALEECLHTLSSNKINLTKIQSRPIPENPWEYVFYVDFEGGLNDDNVWVGLQQLEEASRFLKILGSYPKGDFPEEVTTP